LFVTKLHESKTKRHRPKVISGSQKRPKAKAKIYRSRKRERCFGQVF